MPSPTAEQSQAVEEFGAFAFWPENLDWSFQFIRLICEMYAGGSDFSEVYQVTRDLEPGDFEGWYERFTGLAKRIDDEAAAAKAGGHLITARDYWFRASNYYRASSFFHNLKDERVAVAIDNRRRTFRLAGELCSPPIRPVEIPYEDGSLPAYLISPLERPEPTPATIMFGGVDAISEEMYFCVGKALAERGYTVLSMDGPGQGEALRRGFTTRDDYEVPVGAAVDLLETLPDVDSDRITLIGQSLGGYYAARAAAFEKRLKATVICGAFYSTVPNVADRVASNDPSEANLIDLLQVIWGVDTPEELVEKSSTMSLEGVAEQIECPTLVMHAEIDTKVPFWHAQRTYDEIPETTEKKMIVYPIGTPGCTHCQLDSLPIAQRDMCDWLDDQVK